MRNRCEPPRHRPPDPACEIPCSTKMAIFLCGIYARHDGGNFGERAAFELAGGSTRTACSAVSQPRQGHESISSVSVMAIFQQLRESDLQVLCDPIMPRLLLLSSDTPQPHG